MHRSGWPVSYGSYARGCRCVGCKAKKRAYREQHPELRIFYREHARRRAKGLPTKGLMAQLRANGMLNTGPVAEWVAIEQAIARGVPSSQIMTDLGVAYEAVAAVREAMDGVAS